MVSVVLLNLTVCSEPDYMVRVTDDECNEWYLAIGARNTWKRLSAINHARRYARHNPKHSVHVELVRSKYR